MPAKKLLFRDEARDKIRRGVDTLAEAVKVTLGPRGRTVVLEREFGPPQIVNSGVVVAKSIELEDRFENMGAQLMREVAARTSEMAGDGTTTATVLAHGLDDTGLPFWIALRGGHEQAVVMALSDLLDALQDLAEIRIVDVADDHAERL